MRCQISPDPGCAGGAGDGNVRVGIGFSASCLFVFRGKNGSVRQPADPDYRRNRCRPDPVDIEILLMPVCLLYISSHL